MQIIFNLLRVIFMLSTIVIVTDCCSSRILLLREQNLRIIHEQNFHIGADNFLASEDYKNADVLKSDLDFFYKQISLFRAELENDTATLTTADPIQPLDTGQESMTKTTPTPDSPSSNIDTILTPEEPRREDCTGDFASLFCLNDGKCFQYPLVTDKIIFCECADGFKGERCELKSLNGDLVPASELKQEPKIVMARIVFSFPMLVALSVLYIIIGALFIIRCPSQQKYQASGMLAS